MNDPDAIVIGSGPNGLVAACTLAAAGLRVAVLERDSDRAGGAVGSEAATLPGFVHDVGAAFFAWGKLSPAFRALDLERFGLRWAHSRFESCHPALDGSYACIARDPDLCAAHFGSTSDGDRFRRLTQWHAEVESDFLDLLLRPLGTLAPAWRLGPAALARIATMFARTPRSLARHLFDGPVAQRVLPSLGLHVDVGPDDRFGAALGYVLGLTATTAGYPVPVGGAQAITDALVECLRQRGGEVRLGCTVESIVADEGRAHAVRTSAGDEWRARHCIVADTSAPALYLDLLPRGVVPTRVVSAMERFEQGWGTFKVDWALSGPVPWACEAAQQSNVVHTGESLDDLAEFTREVRGGELPHNPYLVIGQQSLADPTRAPEGQHTLWCYSRVPSTMPGGWAAHRESFCDQVEARIEGLAPGFRDRILARRIVAPPDLEASNPNLRGGDLGGGSNAWHRQLIFRPTFPYFRYRTPVPGLYLGSSYAHPGAGAHGMCGFNAANAALQDIGGRALLPAARS